MHSVCSRCSCHSTRLHSHTKRMQLVAACVLLMVSAAAAAPLAAHGHVPSSACVDMLPVHGNAEPSKKPAPYTIAVTPTSVNAGETLKVQISGTEEFRGVYLQARRGDEPVGEFLLPSGETNRLALSDCPPGHNNAFSYISRTPLDALEIEWKAPDVAGEIVFRATFVKSFSEFWVGVQSPKITVGNPTAVTPDNAVAA